MSKLALRLQLQRAVQSIKWTYSAFWQLSHPKEVLVWEDGYYNGHIKARKPVQAAELSPEELRMQRTRQLRDLYETLSCTGDSNATARRPSVVLSPEDLTETEWFYLLCMSCSFSPGTGLPGEALARNRYVWLEKANEARTETFTRALLAKTAHIKTVLCIPIAEGVAEFGSTELVAEDPDLVQRIITTHFAEPLTPVGSEERSTSSPGATGERTCAGPPAVGTVNDHFAGSANWLSSALRTRVTVKAPSQEAIKQSGISNENLSMLSTSPRGGDASGKTWNRGIHAQVDADVKRPPLTTFTSLIPSVEMPKQNLRLPQLLEDGHDHYEHKREESMGGLGITAFSAWRNTSGPSKELNPVRQQWMLKRALFHITHLYSVQKYQIHHRSGSESNSLATDIKSRAGQRKSSGGQDDLNVSHVLAERRRREKLNDRFMALRALVPFVSKMDKASILGDAIDYVKQLQERIRDMESRNTQLVQSISLKGDQSKVRSKVPLSAGVIPVEAGRMNRTVRDHKANTEGDTTDMATNDVQRNSRSSPSLLSERDDAGLSNSPSDDSEATHVKGSADVKVSFVENEAVLELVSPWTRNTLIDILQTLSDLQLDVFAVQAFTTNGVLNTSCKAKVQESARLTKAEVQAALQGNSLAK